VADLGLCRVGAGALDVVAHPFGAGSAPGRRDDRGGLLFMRKCANWRRGVPVEQVFRVFGCVIWRTVARPSPGPTPSTSQRYLAVWRESSGYKKKPAFSEAMAELRVDNQNRVSLPKAPEHHLGLRHMVTQQPRLIARFVTPATPNLLQYRSRRRSARRRPARPGRVMMTPAAPNLLVDVRKKVTPRGVTFFHACDSRRIRPARHQRGPGGHRRGVPL
jgi:hypothetical protein